MSIPNDTTFDIATAPKRDSKRWEQGTTTWGQIIAWMDSPADVKEAGNYLLGTLKGNVRNKSSILSRGALTLDVDYPKDGFLADVAMLGYTVLYHTTFKSTPEIPRYRVIIPLDRTVAPDEYHVAAGAVMQALGAEQFDQGSVQAERYMFKPSQSAPGRFTWNVVGSGLAQAETLLEDFEDDLSGIPAPKVSRKKTNPYELKGTVGHFNRAYENLDDLIEAYDLPYERAEGVDRYKLVGAAASAGMGPIQGAEGLYFSHHSNDPAYGQTCSAFDLVRLHRFSELDVDVPAKTLIIHYPSHKAMLDLASKDPMVVQDIVGSDFSVLQDIADQITGPDDDSWKNRFNINARTGKIEDEIGNWDMIAKFDKAFRVLQYNELTLAIEINGDLPWRPLEDDRETFTAADRAAMLFHVEREYKLRPAQNYLDGLITVRAQQTRVNPIRDYLNALVWDGTSRIETALPGVVPTDYTRLVARKSLVAAVARALKPGIKWDHMLVLYGTEGLGKSYWVDRMSRGFSVPLGRLENKDTLITMQRGWIITADEGHSMKKSDQEAQKEFLTRTHDIFRAPYEREAQVHPRHSVVWGTTNDPVFLRKQEGNRRFLIVHVESKLDFDQFTDEYVSQVWAEAVHLFNEGEPLFLNDEQAKLAAQEREDYTQETPWVGLIQTYLDTLVPEDWNNMRPLDRQLWFMNPSTDFGTPSGTAQQYRVCAEQILTEGLGKRFGDSDHIDVKRVNEAMLDIPGWKLLPGMYDLPQYGRQRVYERANETHKFYDELI